MDETTVERILKHPKFEELVRKKSRLSQTLLIIILFIYYGFILLIAFAPSTLGTPVAPGRVMTVGIPVAIFVIISAFVLTGIYAFRANTEFDQITRELIEEIRK